MPTISSDIASYSAGRKANRLATVARLFCGTLVITDPLCADAPEIDAIEATIRLPCSKPDWTFFFISEKSVLTGATALALTGWVGAAIRGAYAGGRSRTGDETSTRGGLALTSSSRASIRSTKALAHAF